jgi:hypothetical protein
VVDEAGVAGGRFVHRPSSGRVDPTVTIGSVAAVAGDRLQVGSHPVDLSAASLVWCRLPAARAPRLPAADQDYGDAEMSALMLSWLTGLGDRVVNQPHPLGLAGHQVDLVELHELAARVGLSTPDIILRSSASAWPDPDRDRELLSRRLWAGDVVPAQAPEQSTMAGPPLPLPGCWAEPLTEVREVLVVGGQAPLLPGPTGAALARLAAEAGLLVAEVTIGRRPGEMPWLVAGLSPVPALTGAADLYACAAYLERRVLQPVRRAA